MTIARPARVNLVELYRKIENFRAEIKGAEIGMGEISKCRLLIRDVVALHLQRLNDELDKLNIFGYTDEISNIGDMMAIVERHPSSFASFVRLGKRKIVFFSKTPLSSPILKLVMKQIMEYEKSVTMNFERFFHTRRNWLWKFLREEEENLTFKGRLTKAARERPNRRDIYDLRV